MMRISKIALALAAIAGLSTTAVAGPWQRNHPARTYDNARLVMQNHRITQGVRDGQLTHAQAHQLRADDHAIRAEERADSAVNGSHLTGADQRQIRAQENANSRAIYDGRHY
jgi:hypothetical protein